MMLDERKERYTIADWDALYTVPENQDYWFELLNGIIYETHVHTPLQCYIIGHIQAELHDFVKVRRLGEVFGNGCPYALSDENLLIPDTSFVAQDKITRPFPPKFLFAPDLAVEVASAYRDKMDFAEKMMLYLEYGTKLGWLVYPNTKTVHIYTPNPDGSVNIRNIGIDGVLEGGEVLLGFTLDTKEIFP